VRMDLADMCGQYRRANDRLRAKCRLRGERGWARALGVGAGRVKLQMMMVAGMILAGVMMRSARSIGIAQDDGELAVDRRQHEAGGNERAQAEHREHPGRSPMGCPVAHALRPDSHACQHASRIGEGQ